MASSFTSNKAENLLIKEITRQILKKKVVFFLGAGVSRNAPSSLPLSAEFNRIVLQTLQEKMDSKLSEEEIRRLANIRLEEKYK